MILSPILVALLTAAPVSLAQPEFNAINLPPELVRFCGEHLAAEMVARGVRVVTAQDIASMLGMERQKQLLGCTETSASCMAELASALGTDGILRGDIARLGSRFQINVKILSSTDAQQLAGYRASVEEEDELIPELTRAAEKLVPQLLAKLGRGPQLPPAPPEGVAGPARPRRWPLLPTIVAGALVVGGGALHALAFDANDRLRNPQRPAIDDSQALRLRAQGQVLQVGAYVGYGLAAAGLGTAIFLYLRGESPAVTPVAILSHSGAALGVAGALP